MNETEQLMTGKDVAEKFLWPNVPNVQNLVDKLGIAGKESSLLEFKASYDPNTNPKKPKGVVYEPDVGLWNVVKAIVAFANDVGGCVVLGIDDNGRYVPSERGCDPKGVWKEHEGKDIQNSLFSTLLKDEYVWHKDGVTHRIVLSEGGLRGRLRLVCPKDAFVPCEDNDHRTVAILVAPIPKGDDLIVVDKFETRKSETKETVTKTTICYYRARSVANTEEITIRKSEWVKNGGERSQETVLFDHPEKLRTYAAKRHPEQRQFWEIAKRGRLIPFKILPNSNKGFVGRENELEELRSLLIDQERSVVIHGDGGMGKTELAIQFAHRYVEFFPGGIVFVNAEHVRSWQDVMIQVFESGRRDRIQEAWRFEWIKGNEREPESDRKNRLETNVENALAALGEEAEASRVLFVFDNVESCRFLEDGEINKVFPNGSGQLRVLVTTRGLDTFRLNQSSLFVPFPANPQEALPSLDPASAVKFLESARDGLVGNQILADIASALEFHPWSLEVAKGQLADEAVSPAEYLDRIRHDILSNLGEGTTFRNNPDSLAKLLAPTLDRLVPDVRQLARIVSMFPAEGVDEYVLRRLGSDYLGVPEKNEQNRNSFTAAMSLLCRYHVISFDATDATIRMHRFTQRVLQEDMGSEKQSEADKVSDFLAAWLGFTPFGHDRLRRFAETSLLGRRLLEEVEQAESGNQWTPLRMAFGFVDGSWGYPPFKDAVEKEGMDGIARQLDRRHWVYAYVFRENDPEVEAFFTGSEMKWNSIDRLVVLASVAGDYHLRFPAVSFSSREWFLANQMNPDGGVFQRLGSLSRSDAGRFDDWTSSDFAELTGKDWTDILLGLGINEPFEQRFETIMTLTYRWQEFLTQQLGEAGVPDAKTEVELKHQFEEQCRDAWENDRKVWHEKLSNEIDWNKLDCFNWLMLLNASPLWESLFPEHYGWSRLVDELCKAEKQGELIHLLKNHLEEYGDKFDWTNLPVPASAQSSGPSDWSGWWVETLDLHPEMSDRITPQYLGTPFWVIYSGFNPNLIKDLLEVRHPEWIPEVEKMLRLFADKD